MAACAYAYQPMSEADLPLLRRWLATPHVAEWWGDPREQFALMRDDLDHPAMEQFVVSLHGRPFAYLQCYDPAAWPNHGFGALANGARGIDQFIGEADMIERGHGSALIRAFVDRLLQGHTPLVLTDPHPANARAVRACETAGFRKEQPVTTPDGRALLMVRHS